MKPDTLALVRACLQAYATRDRAAIETLIASDYRFSSPLDNAIDRETYFRRCWPGSEFLCGFDIVSSIADGERAFVVYEARTAAGKRFRNAEMHVARDGKLVATEVYFGWDLPHPAQAGSFVSEPPSAS